MKFGLPRQSGIVETLHGRIELTRDYATPEALRGLEEYDFLWLIWGFSENVDARNISIVCRNRSEVIINSSYHLPFCITSIFKRTEEAKNCIKHSE